MTELNEVFIALALGFVGSTHCAVMCGGISCAAGSVTRGSTLDRVWLLTGFNLGRVASYTLAGLCFGSLTYAAFSWHYQLMTLLRVAAALLLLMMACQLAGFWSGLNRLERLGQRAWQVLCRVFQLSLPVRQWKDGLMLGALWGWLPCGLIYSTLAWAALSSNPLLAGLKMLAFGLGTLPMMMSAGVMGAKAQQWLRAPAWRFVAAGLMSVFALWTLYAAVAHGSMGMALQVPTGFDDLMCVAEPE